MKHYIIKSCIPTALILFFCWNGTLIDSNTKSKLPDINFYGTIEDHYNKMFNAEYILIDKRYEEISVYPYSGTIKLKKHITNKKNNDLETNKNNDIDPTQNKSFLKLDEIKTIELQHPNHPTESTIKINDKDYIGIIVTSINGTQNNYLIENSRKITCKEIDKGQNNTKEKVLIDRELHMIHIKKLTILGYKSVKDSDEKKPIKSSSENISTNDQKKELGKNTANIIDQIEENVKNLSQDNSTAFEKMKNTIITLLKLLREQLQKMLDMIQ